VVIVLKFVQPESMNPKLLLFLFVAWAATPLPHSDTLAGYSLLLLAIRTLHTEVFIVDLDRGEAANVSGDPRPVESHPCWSPDGERIAFTNDRLADLQFAA
jgi:hypothetical protein